MQKVILKSKIKRNYSNIAFGDIASCCSTWEIFWDTKNISKKQVSSVIGYNETELRSIPEISNLGLGCGTSLKFGNIKEGKIVLVLGSGDGIETFLASKYVGKKGKIIGIDMTDEMLEKTRKFVIKNNYKNTEFRKGDTEEKIPIEDNSIDVAISNRIINLTFNKINTFKEIYGVLKKEGKGRMIISDSITTEEVSKDDFINTDNWCSCIDDALTKENYLESIRDAGFQNIEILNEKIYMDENYFSDGRKIISIIVRAITN